MRTSFYSRLGLAALITSLGLNSWAAGRQLTGVYAPTATPALAPAEAQKKFTVPEGFEVRLFAAEPQVVNPVGMTWDERGRLWVVELYEYPLGAAPGTKPRDNIKILEDTDNDGRADKVTVFADGLNLATGVLIGYGGVFVGQAPHLLFMEDTDGDDRADKTTIVKTGFGLEDRHELLNGFTWGPDGQLYMTHGVFTHSNVKNPDDPNDDGVIMTAAVARYHPRTKEFEVFAEGTSNPWGVDFDAKGNAFVSACVIDHLFHMAPGGLYVRQAGNPPYPYAYGLLPSIVDHKHFRAAYAGVQIYQGDQYPEEYQGAVFIGNIHDSSIHQDRLTPDGSSFKASFQQDFLRANDGWFRPVSVQTGPDGALWVMDWYDKYPCYQNANADPEGVDRTHGRIWRVVYTGDEKGRAVPSHPEGLDLKKLRTRELVKVLKHKNAWHRRMAQRILTERQGPGSKTLLQDLLRSDSAVEARLAALWTLHSAGFADDPLLDEAARDREAVIRMWAARITGEQGVPSEAAVRRLTTLASDDDASVVLAVATAARQFVSGSLTVNTPPAQETGSIGEVLTALVLNQVSASDPVIPFLTWMAAEPVVAADPEPAVRWLAENGMQNPAMAAEMVRKSMRRICDTGNLEKLQTALLFLTETPSDAEPLLIAALDGLIEGQKGKSLSPAEPAQALARLGRHSNPEVARRAQELGTLWGDASALQGSLRAIIDPARRADERVQAIQAVRQQKEPAVREALLEVIAGEAPGPVINAALLALGEIGGGDAGERIVAEWDGFSPGSRRIAAQTLTSRTQWAMEFLDAIEAKAVNASEIPTTVVRSLVQSKDDEVRTRAENVIGKYRESDPDKLKLIAEKKRVVLNGPVDLKKGYEVAQRTCFTCHKLHGEGAEVGPDLTGVGRSSLEALLANIIDPNQIIGAGYENVEIETKDERIVSGRLVEQTDTRVKLLAIGPKEEVIGKDEIASMRVSQMSVMPEGLEQMPEEDFRNMIWYLLNPPQDEKPIYLARKENALTVRIEVPGTSGTGYIEIVNGVLDPEEAPYLHPVKFPGGRYVETTPGDVWPPGIFTGLGKLNGIEFASGQEGRRRFVRLLDIFQEQDHAGWRSLSEWVAPDGKVLLEDEQLVKVYAPSSSRDYQIDFDWTLRAKGEAVKIIGQKNDGLSVRLNYDPTPEGYAFLNAAGDRGAAAADQEAAWCAIYRAQPERGIAVFDHPANLGHPPKWRLDEQGTINPSPSVHGEWSIAPQEKRTWHYRMTVHTGEPTPERFAPVFKAFSALNFETVASAGQDGESVALWNPEWRVLAPDFEHSPRKLPEFHGRKNVLLTHPYDQEKGASIERVIDVPAGQKTVLQVNVAAHDQGDWELRIYAGEKLLKKQLVDRAGERWKTVTVDLTPLAGSKVPVRLVNWANDWSWEFGYWSDLRLISSEPKRAAK